MSKIRALIDSLLDHLDENIGGSWDNTQLSSYNFTTTGDQSGWRTTTSPTGIFTKEGTTNITKRVTLGRVFQANPADLSEGRKVAAELADRMITLISRWLYRCASLTGFEFVSADHDVTDNGYARASASDTDDIDETTTTIIGDAIPKEQSGWVGMVVIVFDMSYDI